MTQTTQPHCTVLNFPVQAPPQDQPSHFPVLADGQLLQIANDHFEHEVTKATHAAEPIKDRNDILKIQDYLLSQKRYRDNLLLICGFNLGLRASDLLQLRIGHLLNTDGSYRDEILVQEGKTKKYRKIFPNAAVRYAADLYFSDLILGKDAISLNDPLFPNFSPNSQGQLEPISRRSLDRILKEVINKRCGIDVHASTHCLRKTFAYHYIMAAPDRTRAVELLQRTFGHSSMAVTLYYAGITDDEIMATYADLNLGYECETGVGYHQPAAVCS